MASDNIEALIFFDTFSHDSSEEINLDLVQFPKPVLISEIRIIPLGARVKADFPGGVRLGATNPSQFQIEFFVNDLSKPGASTFERLGGLEYRQNVDIQLECQSKIPTDGLVLRGWYTTITLAVYGVLSKGVLTTVPPVVIVERQPDDLSASAATAEWVQQHAQVVECPPETMYIDPSYNYPIDYQAPAQELHPPYVEGWVPAVPPPASAGALPLREPYAAETKEYEAQPSWSAPHVDTKAWERNVKEEIKSEHCASPNRSIGERDSSREWLDKRDRKKWEHSRDEKDDKEKRDKYWDENAEGREEERMKERRSDKDSEDRGRRSDKEWREDKERYRRRDRDDGESSYDRYHRDKDDSREERSRRKDRDRSRDERPRGRRDRSTERSWSERGAEKSSKSYKENSWERDRDKSPYSEASSYRRRPRSPPSKSPKRPYTPTERFWSPDRREYSSPKERQNLLEPHEARRRSPAVSPSRTKPMEALKVELGGSTRSPQTPLTSPMKPAPRSQSPVASTQSPLAVDEPSLDEEPFEPILSDEDIIDESDSQYPELDYDFADDMEEVVKPFNPFLYQVEPLEHFLDPSLTQCEREQSRGCKDSEQVADLVESLECEEEVKEDWVHAAERVVPWLETCHVAPDSQVMRTLLKWVNCGLSFESAMSHSQPGLKLRHVKVGIRLAETMCQRGVTCCVELVTRHEVQTKLLGLLYEKHMALPIKLQILKALDASLLCEQAVTHFVTERFPISTTPPLTGYQHVFALLKTKQPVRVKFALTSLLKKVHTFEVLQNLEGAVSGLIADQVVDKEKLVAYLDELGRTFATAEVAFAHPARFLPVQSQFETNLSTPTAYSTLYGYFNTHRLLESLLVLLTHHKTSSLSSVAVSVQGLLRLLSNRLDGLVFLACHKPVTDSILKVLCGQNPEEYVEPGVTPSLAVELACRLHVLHCLDRLASGSTETALFDAAHDLYSATFPPAGKSQLAFMLALEDNMDILLGVVERCSSKSPVRSYLLDLIVVTVKYADHVDYLKRYGKQLRELAEDAKLEVVDWLNVATTHGLVAQDAIGPLCEVLQRYTSLEVCAPLPGELVTTVRVLRSLAVPRDESDVCTTPSEDGYTGLKHQYTVLQLYSKEGLACLTAILGKILTYYEQPFTHSTSLLGGQGSNLVSFIEPTVVLLRRMLTYVIAARGSDYKDLTHVTTLIQVHNLMLAYQPNAESFATAQKVCKDVVETLLAYTQPVASSSLTESESFSKSLWSLMIADVLKHITKSSFSLQTGFLLLSELLPLPLPIETKVELHKTEVDHIVKSRKLWSAHLHTLSSVVHDLISNMAGSSYPPLLHVMRRVCMQLADLAAPTALTISRAVLDPLLSTLHRPGAAGAAATWDIPCNSHSLRLFNFLACLLSHPSIKAAVLSLLCPGTNTKSDERFPALVTALTAILRTPGGGVTHAQVQEHVLLIIQAFLDSDVTLVPFSAVPLDSQTPRNEVFLSNALPSRDLLASFIPALLDHVAVPDHGFSTVLSSLKTFLLLTEHDFGFYHLKSCIDAKGEAMWSLLNKMSTGISKENTDSINVLCTLLNLFREMVTISSELTTARTMVMTVSELAAVVRWDSAESEKQHPIKHLVSQLQQWSTADESLVSLCENLHDLIKLLNGESNKLQPESKEFVEPTLPPPLTLVAQFNCRPVYVVGECDEKRLSAVYWLSQLPCEECDQEVDQVTVDLMEVAKMFLPELHLPHEVERVCMLKPTDDDEDPKKPLANKFALSGTRSRRPFVTPMRGRGMGRTAPQRGDLFRSRPPNTSRPPSLHVDDFVALETCGQQPTGPTGYNKISMRAVKDIIVTRARGRGRATYAPDRGRYFGASAYPRRESPRGVSRGRGSWHDELAVVSSRSLYGLEPRDSRLPVRSEPSVGRYLARESMFKDFF